MLPAKHTKLVSIKEYNSLVIRTLYNLMVLVNTCTMIQIPAKETFTLTSIATDRDMF